MSFTQDQTTQLEAKLDKSNVASRKHAGRELSYIEGWHAIAEANRIFGFDAWDRQTVEMNLLGEPRKVGDNMRVGYSCRVRITVRAGETIIVREGCGFGSGIDKDVDQAHESAIKEAETDAMKRALMTFGNPFGLALYDKQQTNVEDPARLPASATRGAVAPAVPSLEERADRLERAMQAADTPEAVEKAFKLGAGLCADLDAKDPERLVVLEKIKDARIAILTQSAAA